MGTTAPRGDGPGVPLLLAALLASLVQAGCGGDQPAAPTCDDGRRNGDETDVDCGGGCDGCPAGGACLGGSDCESGGCEARRCLLALTQACGVDAGCASGFCGDGVCCQARCDGTCEACNLAGRMGTCEPVPDGDDPDDECTQQETATCGTTGSCSGRRSCALQPAGTACSAASCGGSVSQPASACDGDGACRGAAPVECAPFACEASSGACLAACAGPGDCQPGFSCAGGACRKAQGSSCAAGAECASGLCSDGFCCDARCDGVCESCRLSGAEGACTAMPTGQDPDAECAAEAPATCGRTGSCSGDRRCRLHPAGTPCREASCDLDLGSLNLVDACDGQGVCLDHGQRSCQPYLCDPNRNVCRASCVGDWHCQPGYLCDPLGTGACVPT